MDNMDNGNKNIFNVFIKNYLNVEKFWSTLCTFIAILQLNVLIE